MKNLIDPRLTIICERQNSSIFDRNSFRPRLASPAGRGIQFLISTENTFDGNSLLPLFFSLSLIRSRDALKYENGGRALGYFTKFERFNVLHLIKI